MNLFLITYDIADEQEAAFTSEINKIGLCCQVTKSAWLLKPSNSIDNTDSLFEKLIPLVKDGNGHLFITKVSKGDMAGWLASNVIDWINKLP